MLFREIFGDDFGYEPEIVDEEIFTKLALPYIKQTKEIATSTDLKIRPRIDCYIWNPQKTKKIG